MTGPPVPDNPADASLLLPIIGECDCCTRKDVPLTLSWVFGIETFACDVCRGEDDEDC